jgi:hypothetical protein
MATIQERITELGISATITEGTDELPPFEMKGSIGWTVTLHLEGRRMTTPFWQGPAVKDPPDAATVLDCLVSDATTIEDTPTFEDWAVELGFNPDSIRAYRTWQAVGHQTRRLRQFLGEHYDALLWDTERL